MASIWFNISLINNEIGNDFKKLDLLYTEISQNKTNFPAFLTTEQSEKGPKYLKWVYRNIDSTTFIIYYLADSELKSRKYPDDLGWVEAVVEEKVFYILFSDVSEIEKEKEIAKLNTMPTNSN